MSTSLIRGRARGVDRFPPIVFVTIAVGTSRCAATFHGGGAFKVSGRFHFGERQAFAANCMSRRDMVRPARLERATSWFVVVTRKIDQIRLRTMKIHAISDLQESPHSPSTANARHKTACLGGVASQAASQLIRRHRIDATVMRVGSSRLPLCERGHSAERIRSGTSNG
jgi:hypothetical protein